MGKDVFDCIDGDGSGIISTAELHEGLTVCRDPPRSHELLECRLKVREMQLWLHNRLKPEVNQIRRMLLDLWNSLDLKETSLAVARVSQRDLKITQAESVKHVDFNTERNSSCAQ